MIALCHECRASDAWLPGSALPIIPKHSSRSALTLSVKRSIARVFIEEEAGNLPCIGRPDDYQPRRVLGFGSRSSTRPYKLRQTRAVDQIGSGAAWIGSPEEIVDQIRRTQDAFGSYEHASLQVNFNMVPLNDALASMRLFAEQVLPHFTRAE